MRAPASLSPSTLLVLLQLPQLPLLALTLPDELPESEPDSQTPPPPRLSVAHFLLARAGYTPGGQHGDGEAKARGYSEAAVVAAAAAAVVPPFCLRQLSVLGPDFAASDLGPLQQRFLLRVALLFRSPVFHSESFSLSGITTTSCSGALQQQRVRVRQHHMTLRGITFNRASPGDIFCLPAASFSLISRESMRLDTLCFLFLALLIFSQLLGRRGRNRDSLMGKKPNTGLRRNVLPLFQNCPFYPSPSSVNNALCSSSRWGCTSAGPA